MLSAPTQRVFRPMVEILSMMTKMAEYLTGIVLIHTVGRSISWHGVVGREWLYSGARVVI